MLATFKSERHPGTSLPAIVFGRAFVRPLATCLLPVMIVATLLVLTGIDPLPFLVWSTPPAYLIATGWTAYDLGRIVAEVRVQDEWAAVLSVWEVARGQEPETWKRILRVKEDGYGLLVSHGRSVLEFLPEEWPDFEALYAALQQAGETGYRDSGEAVE